MAKGVRTVHHKEAFVPLPSLPGEEVEDYTALSLHLLRRVVPRCLRQKLSWEGRWYDVRMWAFTAALEAHRAGLGLKEASNLAQRMIYHALKAEGYRRKRGGGWAASADPLVEERRGEVYEIQN
ncbi:MAG TPA: hypothetical protein EYP17_04315 [Candidatus Latescibacteria bacterium]|nr:hypothetical protein [Candidatus Latescibacterota bacterium]